MIDEQIRDVLMETQRNMLNCRPKVKCHHEFSKKYIRRKRMLIERDKHPIWFWVSRIAATVLLVTGLSGVMILGYNEKVRAEFFRWITERLAENTYRYQGISSEEIDISEYSLEGMEPKGYQCVERTESDNSIDEVFANDGGQLLFFVVMSPNTEEELYVVSDKDKKPCEIVNLKGNRAEIYISENVEESNTIIWQNKEGVLFSIKGILNKEQLIELAELVE